MFCPKCRQEYLPGIAHCETCGAALVAELEPESADEAEWLELVTVLETADPLRMEVVRSLLEAEQIPCVVDGENARRAIGLIGGEGGLGPWRVQVPAELADAARELIADRGSEIAEDSEPSTS